MARKPASETAETSTDLAIFTSLLPVTIVTDQARAEELFTHIEKQIAAFVPDLTTDTGRRAIASLAFKVSKTKTAITAAAEELIEEARKKVNTTVAERRRIEDRLDGLRDKARKPLTDWEEAEKNRIARVAEQRETISAMQMIRPTDTAADISASIVALEVTIYSEDEFGEDAATLGALRSQAVEILQATKSRLEQQERDRLELEQLRAERAEKARQDAEAEAERQRQQEEAEAAQRAAEVAARNAELERLAREQHAENARLAAEAETRRIEEAAAAAQIEERRRADKAIEDQKAAHAAEMQRLQDQQAAEAKARQADADRAARLKAEKDAEDERIAQEVKARQEDQDHRRQVKTDAKNAFMACGCDEQTARNIVLAIVGGDVPNVTISF